MNWGLLYIFISAALSIIAYFIPSLREGKRIFAPMPGMIAIKMNVKGEPTRAKSKTSKLVLNSFLILFVIAMLWGYKIMIEILIPHPSGGAALVPIIPGVTVPLNVLVTLIWIIGISVAVHEYAHYWSAIKQGISVKSAGVGWFLFFPIAFVEPDEQELMNKSLIERLRVYAAGPSANMIIALLTFAILFASMKPGIYVVEVQPGSVAWKYGIKPGDVIVSVNGVKINNLIELGKIIEKAGKFKIEILRNGKLITLEIEKPKGRIGIFVTPWRPVGILASLPPSIVEKVVSITMWMNGINMGLAIINALPMFITDGGKVLMEIGSVSRRLEKISWIVQVLTVMMVVQALVNSMIRLR